MRKSFVFMLICFIFINGCCSKKKINSKNNRSKIKHSNYISYDNAESRIESLGQSNKGLANKEEKSSKMPQASAQTRKILAKINRNLASIKKNKNTSMGMVNKKW